MRRDRQLIRNFHQLVELKMTETPTHQAAYNEAERVWVEQTGRTFYRNYDTFRRCQTYYRKAKIFAAKPLR